MLRQRRINIRLIGAALCALSGLIILWRTFVSPSDGAGTMPGTVVVLRETASSTLVVPTAVPASPTIMADSTPSPQRASPTRSPIASTPLQPTLTASVLAVASVVSVPVPSITTPLPVSSTALLLSPTPINAAPLPSAIVPSAALPSSLPLTAVPTSTNAVTSIPATDVPTIVNLASPTSTLVPTASATPSLEASQTSEVVATDTPSPSPTFTATATATATLTGSRVALYKVQGNSTNIVIEYLDAQGRFVSISQVTLPWELSFPLGEETDLYVNAFSESNDASIITCSIWINGKVQLSASGAAQDEVECDLPAP